MTYYNATSGESHIIDGREVAPSEAKEELYHRNNTYTGKSSCSKGCSTLSLDGYKLPFYAYFIYKVNPNEYSISI